MKFQGWRSKSTLKPSEKSIPLIAIMAILGGVPDFEMVVLIRLQFQELQKGNCFRHTSAQGSELFRLKGSVRVILVVGAPHRFPRSSRTGFERRTQTSSKRREELGGVGLCGHEKG